MSLKRSAADRTKVGPVQTITVGPLQTIAPIRALVVTEELALPWARIQKNPKML